MGHVGHGVGGKRCIPSARNWHSRNRECSGQPSEMEDKLIRNVQHRNWRQMAMAQAKLDKLALGSISRRVETKKIGGRRASDLDDLQGAALEWHRQGHERLSDSPSNGS